MNDNKKLLIKRLVIAFFILSLVAVIIYGLVWSQKDNETAPIILQGQMQIQQSAIASKVPGRISKILVTEGDKITTEQQLVHMDSPEINAKIQQAMAGQEMAKNQLNKALNGARPQEVAQAKAAWQANQAMSKLAHSTYQRIERLYKEGLMSRQKRDEAYTQYIAQQNKTTASKEQYQMAQEGARNEDIETARAQVEQVNGKLQEALVAEKEANLRSPINGVVNNIFVNPGEVVGKGVPLLSLTDPTDQWVILNVTETNLSRFPIGSTFTAEIPALSKKSGKYSQDFTVFASSALADFATWRPTSQNDGFDVRTFEIKARPKQPNEKVRSGMSVIVTLPAESQK